MQLNAQQRSAVETKSPKALVIAGAGSGKTRVLIERIAWLTERGVSPFEIMAFTFTRKAAGEMMERLENRIEGATKCTMGTMHAIALSFLRRFGEIMGLNPGSITIYSEWESGELLKQVIKELGVKGVSKKAIQAVFDAYYQNAEMPDELNPVYSIFHAFLARCRENNAMTYGTLLIEFYKLIPEIQDFVNFKCLLVDEVQDIDQLQWRIIDRICNWFGATLFAVGDIDQSIYEFRGAVPGYLVERQSEFDIFNLAINYRSDAHIVDAANWLIENNQNRITKASLPHHNHFKSIEIEENTDSDQIVKLCKRTISENPAKKVAILARNHFLLKKLDRLLGEEYLEHKYIGRDVALANTKDFRIFHAFLKLMVNPLDNFSFMLIKDYLGVSDRQYLEIRKKAAAEVALGHPTGHFGAYKKIHGVPIVFCADPQDPPGHVAGYIKADFPELDPDEYIIDFVQNAPGANIQAYLDWLATLDIQDEIKEDYDGIQLMTIHAAKGLEWPIVIVAGCNDGILPSKQSIDSGDIEPERRLAYVAWTRAQDHLILTVRPEQKKFKGKIINNPISRFINESLPIVS